MKIHCCAFEHADCTRAKAWPHESVFSRWASSTKAPTGWGTIADPSCVVFDEASGYWVLDNGEYSGPILFCPWCGADLSEVAATQAVRFMTAAEVRKLEDMEPVVSST